MPRFAANLGFMYTEMPFEERFAAAASDGFRAVEYPFPYTHDRHELALRLADLGLRQVLINAPPGSFELGDRGLAAMPGREDEFRRSWLEQALPYAHALGCPRVHLMAGCVPLGADTAPMWDTYLDNLAWAARLAAGQGVDVLIEPINTRDIPHYLLNRQEQAHAVVAEVGAVNLKVQMDLYHCQIVEGDLAVKLRRYLPGGRVGHIQIASVPDRQEPDLGEVQYGFLFDLIDSLHWAGHVGCEYRPSAGTSAGLGWFQPYKDHQT